MCWTRSDAFPERAENNLWPVINHLLCWTRSEAFPERAANNLWREINHLLCSDYWLDNGHGVFSWYLEKNSRSISNGWLSYKRKIYLYVFIVFDVCHKIALRQPVGFDIHVVHVTWLIDIFYQLSVKVSFWLLASSLKHHCFLKEIF